jgi:hypothetical protein
MLMKDMTPMICPPLFVSVPRYVQTNARARTHTHTPKYKAVMRQYISTPSFHLNLSIVNEDSSRALLTHVGMVSACMKGLGLGLGEWREEKRANTSM